jgi:hypothetical protein
MDSPTGSVARNGRRKPATTDSIHTIQLSRCRPAWGDHQNRTVAVRVALRPRPSHFTDVRSTDLTCAADSCGATRTRVGQAFIRGQGPRTARNWVPPMRCPRGGPSAATTNVRARFVVSFLVSYMFVYLGPPRAAAGSRAGRETSMASPGLSSLILKSGRSAVRPRP